MAVTDPDRYLDPAKYEAYIAAFLQGGNTEEEARLNLKRTGFNLPGEETVSETMTDTAITEPGATSAGPELEQWKSLMDPDLSMPTEQGFQQAGTEIEESLTEVEGMRPIQEYAQGLMDKNPLPGAADERPLFQRLMTAGARQNLKPRPSKKVEPEPEPKIEEAALVQEELKPKDEETRTEVLETEDDPKFFAKQISTMQEDVAATITSPQKKTIFSEAVEFINELNPEIGTQSGFYFFGDNKQDYLMLRDRIDTEIDKYETSIQDIAQEKQKPPLEGANQWLAILGVALGAAGSALTRTPNEAMQMLDGFLDREQQKFLKSKEMKMRSADQQRLDLIRRRGELLQQFQNETQRVMQISQFQLQKTKALTNIQSIQQQLEESQLQNDRNYQLAVSKIIKDLIVADTTLKASAGKSERERIVQPVVLIDGDGNAVPFQGYMTNTAKEGLDHRSFNGLLVATTMKLNEMEELLKDKSRFAPSLFSQTSASLVGLGSDLETLFKKLNNFGANYSAKEIQLNITQIPQFNDNKFQNLLGRADKTLYRFRNKLIEDLTARMASQGATPMHATIPKSGTGKTYGAPRNK
jgi:hypothetical protein